MFRCSCVSSPPPPPAFSNTCGFCHQMWMNVKKGCPERNQFAVRCAETRWGHSGVAVWPPMPCNWMDGPVEFVVSFACACEAGLKKINLGPCFCFLLLLNFSRARCDLNVCYRQFACRTELPKDQAYFHMNGKGSDAAFLARQSTPDPLTPPPLLMPSSTLPALLSGTFFQTLPDLVTPLKGHSLSSRSCPVMRSAPCKRFGY